MDTRSLLRSRWAWWSSPMDGLATELVNAAETIVGDLPHVSTVSIGWHDEAGVGGGTVLNG